MKKKNYIQLAFALAGMVVLGLACKAQTIPTAPVPTPTPGPTSTYTKTPTPIATVSVSVNSSNGASVALTNGTGVLIPPGVLSANTTVTISEFVFSDSPSLPSGFQYLGNVYSFNSGSATINGSVTMVFPYTTPLPNGVTTSELEVVYYNGSSWVAAAPQTLDPIHQEITVISTHFSLWGVVGNENSSFTPVPTGQATLTLVPTLSATPTTSNTPTNSPTFTTTNSLTVTPTYTPSSTPTFTFAPGTYTPTNTSSFTPTDTETITPTSSSTSTPTLTFTITPSGTPTNTITSTATSTATTAGTVCLTCPGIVAFTGITTNGNSQIAFIATSNLQASQVVYFTNESYDATVPGLVPENITIASGSAVSVASDGVTIADATTVNESIISYTVGSSGLPSYTTVIIGSSGSSLQGGTDNGFLILNHNGTGDKVLAFTVSSGVTQYVAGLIFGPDSWYQNVNNGSSIVSPDFWDSYLPPGLDATTSIDLSTLWNSGNFNQWDTDTTQNDNAVVDCQTTLSGIVWPWNWTGDGNESKTKVELGTTTGVSSCATPQVGYTGLTSPVTNTAPTYTPTP